MMAKKLLVAAATISLGIAGFTTLDAATLRPLPTQSGFGVMPHLVNATETFFDYFDEGQSRKGIHLMMNREALDAPYTLLSPEKGPSTFGMVLVSLGMMAIIVHRRREI